MELSKRSNRLQSSPIRKFIPIADATKKRGIKVYHLNIGQPDIETPKEFMEAIKKYDEKTIYYAKSKGSEELIEKMVAYYKRFGMDFEKDEILITNGGSEALSFVISTVCDSGDEIIIPEPFYTNYNAFATINGVNIKVVPTNPEDGFKLPAIQEFEKVINEKTRAILISNPCNPTGAIYTKEQLEILRELALKHNLFIISDEVYREFTYDGMEFMSIALFEDISDRVIIVDSVSKRFSACGARIGNIASKNSEFMKGILKMNQSRLCSPTLEMIGAAALYDMPEEYFKDVLKEYESRRDILFEGLMNIEGIECKKPKGAFYIVASLPVDNAEDFVKFMLQEFSDNNETLMITPAENFYGTPGKGRNQARITYTLNKNDLKRAIELLQLGLKAYSEKR